MSVHREPPDIVELLEAGHNTDHNARIAASEIKQLRVERDRLWILFVDMMTTDQSMRVWQWGPRFYDILKLQGKTEAEIEAETKRSCNLPKVLTRVDGVLMLKMEGLMRELSCEKGPETIVDQPDAFAEDQAKRS